MANLNKVMLMGHMTRDVELKALPSGTSVAEFGLAMTRKWSDQGGAKKEETCFVDCVVFGKLADVIGAYKKKGDPLFVEGRLKLDQWEKDGTKRSKIRVIVESFQFLNRAQPQGDGGYQGEAGEQPQRQAAKPRAQQAAPQDDAPPIDEADVPF